LDRVVTSVIVSEGEGRWTKYAGGYSDMVAQRGHGVTAPGEVRREARPRQSAPVPPVAAMQKLSFKQKFALEQLPAKLAGLEAEIARLTADLADPRLYARDADTFMRLSAALESAQEKLRSAEDEWLELET